MIGQTISHYRILEKIGEGGMGVVYKAEDTRLGRLVAIKILAPHLVENDAAKRRFVQEAKAASTCDHPNVSTVYEIDETPDGRVFIAMAFHGGETLGDKIARGPLSVDDALSLTRQISAGLAAVHDQGVVHRDIKPGNIIVTESGDAKVVDFGLALLRDVTKITKSGTTVGTLAYMSPEQSRGAAVDARTDVFSLGCVLYEMIAGQPAFGGTHEAAIIYAIINEEPSPVAKYRSGVPTAIQRIVDRMLAKNPDQRHASMREVIRDIDAVRSGSGVALGPRRISRRLSLWVGLLVVLVMGTAVVWKSLREGAPAKPKDVSLAILDFRGVGSSDSEAYSAGLTSLLQVGLIESAPCRVVSAEYLYDLRRRLFGSATGPITPDQALEVARKSGADVLLTGQCVTGAMDQYVAWQLVDAHSGEGLAARRVEGQGIATIADGVIGDVLPLLARRCGTEDASKQTPVEALTTSSADAYTHYVAGLTLLDRQLDEEAIREFEMAVGMDSTFALGWFGLARACGGKRDNAADGGQRGCKVGERAWALRSRLGIRDRMLLEAWLARTCRDDIPGAIETHRELVARWPDDRDAIAHLVDMLTWIHMGGEAIPIGEAGLEKYPNDDRLKLSLVWALASAGHLQEAIALQRELIRADPDNANHWDNMGLFYVGLGQPDSAEAAFRKANALTPDFSAVSLAESPFYRGDTQGAIERLRDLNSSDTSEPDRRRAQTEVVKLLAERGRFADAFALVSGTSTPGVALPKFTADYPRFLLSPDRSYDRDVKEALERAFDGLASAQTPVAEFRAHWGVVTAGLSLDSTEIARASFEKMQQLVGDVFPRNAHWWRTCAEFSLADDKPEDALRYLKQVERTATWPGTDFDIRRRTDLARAYRMLGQHNEAVRELKELLRLYPGHYLAEYELGQVYDDMKRPGDAATAYTKFLEYWADADPGLVQVKHARERLTALRSTP